MFVITGNQSSWKSGRTSSPEGPMAKPVRSKRVTRGNGVRRPRRSIKRPKRKRTPSVINIWGTCSMTKEKSLMFCLSPLHVPKGNRQMGSHCPKRGQTGKCIPEIQKSFHFLQGKVNLLQGSRNNHFRFSHPIFRPAWADFHSHNLQRRPCDASLCSLRSIQSDINLRAITFDHSAGWTLCIVLRVLNIHGGCRSETN